MHSPKQESVLKVKSFQFSSPNFHCYLVHVYLNADQAFIVGIQKESQRKENIPQSLYDEIYISFTSRYQIKGDYKNSL